VEQGLSTNKQVNQYKASIAAANRIICDYVIYVGGIQNVDVTDDTAAMAWKPWNSISCKVLENSVVMSVGTLYIM